VSNLYVRQANLKVILELTGSQCSSERRAVAGCCERLRKTTRAAEVCTRCNYKLRFLTDIYQSSTHFTRRTANNRE